MLLKRRKSKRLWFFSGIAAVILLSIATISIEDAKLSVRETWEAFLATDPGFSSYLAIADSPSELPVALLSRVPAMLRGELLGYVDRPMIDRIDLDIKFMNYRRLLTDRENALAKGILVDPVEVPARIRYQGVSYKARIRLKGDNPDHWNTRSRMSFRVKKKGNGTIQGFKRFSLHRPASRTHPHDASFQALVRQLGVLAPEHKYLRVFVNGVNWGIMDAEEHLTKELLEKQAAKESIITRFGDQQVWHYQRVVNSQDIVKDYWLSDPRLYFSISRQNKMLDEDINRRRLSYIVDKRLSGETGELYDSEKFSRAWLAALAWNNSHTLLDSNMRTYLNPYTMKLEPITTDQGLFASLDGAESCEAFATYAKSINIFKELAKMPSFEASVRANARLIAGILPAALEEIEQIHSYFPLDREIDAVTIEKNVQLINNVSDRCLSPMGNTRKATTNPAPVVISDEQAAQLPAHLYIRHMIDGQLQVFNLLPEPVQLEAIFINGQRIQDFTPIQITGHADNPVPVRITTDITGIRDGTLEFESEFRGFRSKQEIGITLYPLTRLHNPLLATESPLPDFVQADGDRNWSIKPGHWTVRKPMVIDGSLHINAGTVLKFETDTYLIVKGEFTAVGSEKSRITLKPVNEHWKGLYVLAGQADAKLHFTDILNTRALSDGLLQLTAGVTFYQANVEIKNVVINGTIAEDALNLVHSQFVIENSTISTTRSDALDSDFSDGRIDQSQFLAVGGDAIDISGSSIIVTETIINDVHDKAISAGEESRIELVGGKITQMGVGVAAKDGSTVIVRGTHFGASTLPTLMSYVKKDFYGKPALESIDATFAPNVIFARQPGSFMSVDGVEIPAEEIDVDRLYQQQIMKKL